MKKSLSIIVLAVLFVLVVAQPVAACDGFLCNAFGMTDRAEINAQRAEELARIEREKAAEVARIEAAAQERLAEAEAQLQREVQAGQLAQEQATQQAESFRAMLAANTDKAIRAIELEYDQAAAVITSQTDIALAGIIEAGRNSRLRIGLEGISGIVALLVIGAVVMLFIYRHSRTPAQQPTVILLDGTNRPALRAPFVGLPGDTVKVIEGVKHE